jgi:hypothetical protein
MHHTRNNNHYPDAVNPSMVGQYPAKSASGGGYFYDEVLEYRVWVHPPGEEVYYHAFAKYEDALEYSKRTPKVEIPLVLVSQEEYIHEPSPGKFIHIKKPRVTEWFPDWLENSKGTKEQIPLFMKQKT